MAGLGTGGPTFAQPEGNNPRRDKLFADWKQRQDRLKSARYTVVGTVEFKDKPLLPDDPPLPSGDPVRPKRVMLLLDLERKRFRLESSEEVIAQGHGYVRRVGTSAFDGKALYALTHRDVNGFTEGPDLAVAKGNLAQQQLDKALLPVFFAHGIVPTAHAPLSPKSFLLTPDKDAWQIQGVQTLGGRPCLVVRTEPLAGNPPVVDEFWVDSARESAIVRYVSFNGSNPWDRMDIESKETGCGWWVDHWTSVWSVNGQVRRIQRLRVESFEPNAAVSDDDFVIPGRPGMTVVVQEYPELGTGLNPQYPASKTYQISSSGAWEETAAQGFTTLDGSRLPPAGKSWPWWVAGTTAVMAMIVSTWVVRRRWRRTAAA